MAGNQVAPYGSWKSPITSDLMVQGTISLSGVRLDGDEIYWLEGRPSEGGRMVAVRRKPDGSTEDLTPAPFNVRTRVHEYGGGALAIHNGTLYFSNFADNHLYVRRPDGQIQAITSDSKKYYADGVIDGQRQLWIGVREDHTDSDIFAVNTIVAMGLDGGNERVLVSGNDFYSNFRISPDGAHVCWLTWNHPNMPWDGTELWVAEFTQDGQVANARQVAGGPEESVLEPVWSPQGNLIFVSDKTNWWNLYRLDDIHHGNTATPVCPMAAEFAGPSWVFGISSYTFIDSNIILCTYTQNGRDYLAKLDVQHGQLTELDGKNTVFGSIQASEKRLAYIAASPNQSSYIITCDLNGSNGIVVKKSSSVVMDPAYLSSPQSIEYPTEGDKTAHAIYYPPTNPDFEAPDGEKPPLLVHVHGGPTGATASSLSLETQYWTSRGFAVVDVNYGGSTGYGREYRDRLKGNWGIVDVDDSVNAARFLVRRGDADGNRIAIAGGSAGGYTTLAALTFRDVFRAGASYFGLSELEIFAQETHKFESRYMDSLLGPYPQAKDIYYNRSPINFTQQLSCPVIFFQGLDDKIVPPNQAELMVEALRKKGLPVAYVTFEGEGHGFRQAANIKRSIDGEFYFYSRVFGFEPADEIEPVPIENLK